MYVGVRTIAKLLAYKESIIIEDGLAQTNTMNYNMLEVSITSAL